MLCIYLFYFHNEHTYNKTLNECHKASKNFMKTLYKNAFTKI